MDIDFKTKLGDIIDPGEVEAAFSLSNGSITKLEDCSSSLSRETAGSAGFSKFALNINGSTPLYDKAIALESDLDAEVDIFHEIRSLAVSLARAHRITELSALRNAITTEISSLRSDMAVQEAIKNDTTDRYTDSQKADAQTDYTNDQKAIEQYQDKLDKVNYYLATGDTPTYAASRKNSTSSTISAPKK